MVSHLSRKSQGAKGLDRIFYPRSVAIVGVSPDPTNFANLVFLFCVQRFEFPGDIYLVGARGDEVSGLRVYRSIRDIPGPVDHVIVSIPAHLIPQLMKDCVSKGVNSVHIFSSGFSESGQQEGIRLEQEIVAIAKRGGIRIVGPNCMGVYNPAGKLSFGYNFPRESGPVAYLSQSGGNTFHMVRAAAARGIRFSKVISYGNAADLNETDFLEYFAADLETQLIAAYVEGVKDGRTFARMLRQAAQAKPVIVLKGGSSDAGTRAAASHTGALAGSDAVWDALFRQAGVVRVHDLEEMVDVIVTFLLMPLPRGRRVGLVGLGGGASVQGADDCARVGFSVPPLAADIQKRLAEIFNAAGISLGNPVDSQVLDVSPEQFGHTITTVASSADVDFIIAHVGIELGPFRSNRPEVLEPRVEAMIESGRAVNKPLAIVLHTASSGQSLHTVADVQQKYYAAGFPIYNTIGAAANAINKFMQFHERRGARSNP